MIILIPLKNMFKKYSWLIYASLYSLVALITSVVLVSTGFNHFTILIIVAPIVSFFSSSIFWVLLKGGKNNASTVSIGILTSIFSHYFTWIILFLIQGEINISTLLSGSLLFTFFSIIIAGWFTFPFAIISAYFINKKCSKIERGINEVDWIE